MKPVIQEHSEGCGIACAAILSQRSYQETAKIAADVGIVAGNKQLYNATQLMRN